MPCARLFMIALLAVLALIGRVGAQIPAQISVTLPVNGYLVLSIDERLLLFDTFTGDVETLDTLEAPKTTGNPRLDFLGEQIAYLGGLDVKVLEPVSGPERTIITHAFDAQVGLFSPFDWHVNGDLVIGRVSGGPSNNYELRTLNAQNGETVLLRSYQRGVSLAEDPSLEFFGLDNASWNPVHTEWIAMRLGTFPVGSEDTTGEGRFSVAVALVFNHVTGETLLANDFLFGQVFSGTSPIWSPDGRFLFIETVDAGLNWLHILEFGHTGSAWTFDVVRSGVKEWGTSVDYWLGVQDMVIERSMSSSTYDLTYYVGQIIDGELQRQEFLRIPLTEFSNNVFGNIYLGDWHITASDEEKRELSCLFDHAQPARFGVGDRARVNFTDGTPLRLREAPDLDAAEVMQMPEGTEFDVIGGPACVNANDYYRFWQIELDDSITGWAAEAGMTDYFMEPVLDVVPTANAGPDQTVTAADGISAQVTLDGSGSTGDIVSYVWTIDDVEIATGVNPSVALEVGVHVITLTVTDDGGATDSDQVTITVEAPAVTCDTTITAGDVTGLKAAITSANGAGSPQTICLEV
jgi:hypothetical protein